MAVYTEVSDDQLRGFLAAYDLGDPLSFKGIAEGVENSNYLLRTTTGAYILTLYEKRVREADLPFFLGLMEHLAANGVPCPAPVADRSGRTHGRIAGRPAAIVRFLDGIWLRRPRPIHCARLGRALAHMHLAGRGFAGTRANTLGPSCWRSLHRSCATAALAHNAPGPDLELARDLDELEASWPGGLPRGIVHADLFPDNVFFIADELSGLIDFYFACNDLLAYDLTVCLNAWCFEPGGAFNVTKARALLGGYAGSRPLEPEEIAALPILCRGSAMRFLLTRLHDRIHHVPGALVRPKDPAEYLARLRFHRQVSGPQAYGIDS